MGTASVSMFHSTAPELRYLEIARLMGFEFDNISSWLELATNILGYARWAPERATQVQDSMPQVLPPPITPLLRIMGQEIHTGEPGRQLPRATGNLHCSLQD